MQDIQKVSVKASNEYDILIGHNLLDLSTMAGSECGKVLEKSKDNSITFLIITDDIVSGLYSQKLEKVLDGYGLSHIKYVIKNGEYSKNIKNFSDILEFMAQNKMSRSDYIIALGGGVVGDLAGFVASTYLRGIKFIQVPTTFLACIDSSVGGKTGINLNSGKNLAGAFYQPSQVLCDLETLKTLPKHIFADGIAEAIKYGMIADKELFQLILNDDINKNLQKIVARCVQIKSDIVSQDEFDNGQRQLLNFGHTIGHAIEKCSNYKITHGHGVAIGMAIITKAAYKLNFCSNQCYTDLICVLNKYDLPTTCEFDCENLSKVALSDKKIKNGNITLIIPEKTGHCYLKSFKTEEIINIIKLGLS